MKRDGGPAFPAESGQEMMVPVRAFDLRLHDMIADLADQEECSRRLAGHLSAAEDRCQEAERERDKHGLLAVEWKDRAEAAEAECNRLREAAQEALMLLGETMVSPQKISAVKKAVAVALAAVKEAPRE
jgi:hypothetical protein